MITVVFSKTIILLLFPTEYKINPFRVVLFDLTKLKGEKHPCIRVRFYEYSSLENSTYVTNLLVDEFSIAIETTYVDS